MGTSSAAGITSLVLLKPAAGRLQLGASCRFSGSAWPPGSSPVLVLTSSSTTTSSATSASRCRRDNDKPASWREDVLALLAKDKSRISWSDCKNVPDDIRYSDFQYLSERQQVCFGYHLAKDADAKCIDVGQTVGRAYLTTDENYYCFTPNGAPMLVRGQDSRILTGMERMLVHGFDRCELDDDILTEAGLTDEDLASLAGNSFVANACTAMMLGIFRYWPGKSPSRRQAASSSSGQGVEAEDDELMSTMLRFMPTQKDSSKHLPCLLYSCCNSIG
jgi:hypothetical protein